MADLKSMTEGYITAHQLSSQYEESRKRTESAKALEERVENETGENLGLFDENSAEFKQGKAAEELENHYKSQAVNYAKANLASIVKSIPRENATGLIATFGEHEDKTPLGKLFSDYMLYSKFAAGPQKDEKGEVDEAGYKETAERVKKNIPGGIAKRIEAKTGNKELAEKWAAYLAPFAESNEKYFRNILKSEITRIQTELGNLSPDALANYAKSAFEKDDNYLNFALAAYAKLNEKK